MDWLNDGPFVLRVLTAVVLAIPVVILLVMLLALVWATIRGITWHIINAVKLAIRRLRR
jgi:hypothetical protein